MSDETIQITRATVTTDPYGDPVPGAFKDHLALVGKFAPNNPEEAAEVGRNAVIHGGTVYARTSTQPDVQATDRAVIRGVEYEIDGEVGFWRRSTGWGVQFAVKVATVAAWDDES